MNLAEIATYCLGCFLIGAIIWWYYTTGHTHAKKGVGSLIKLKQAFIAEFDNPLARQVVSFLRNGCKQPSVTWFMFGIAVEAGGLGIQGMFGMDLFPLLDFLVAGIIATALYVYQNRKVKNVQST